MEDAAQLDNVIAEVQNISSINWDTISFLPMTRYTRIFPAHFLIQYFGHNADRSHYGSEYGTDHADSLHVHHSRKRETGILMAVGIANLR